MANGYARIWSDLLVRSGAPLGQDDEVVIPGSVTEYKAGTDGGAGAPSGSGAPRLEGRMRMETVRIPRILRREPLSNCGRTYMREWVEPSWN